MRTVRVEMYLGEVRVLAGWPVAASDEYEIIDRAGRPVRWVGATPEAVLPLQGARPARDGFLYAAKWELRGALPQLSAGDTGGPVLAWLDARQCGPIPTGFAREWRPVLGTPRLRAWQEPGEEEGAEPRKRQEPLFLRAEGGGSAEVAIVSLGKWEAVELVEFVPSRPTWPTLATVMFGEPPAAPLERRIGLVVREDVRRVRWVPADYEPEWRRNLPAELREQV